MGARGRDHGSGRALSLGWDDPAPPVGRAAADPDPAPAPRGSGRRGRRMIALGAVLAMVLTLLIALPRLLDAATGPEQVTREFLQAVVDRDLETVRTHLADPDRPGGAALTPAILAGAEDTLEDFEIREVTTSGSTAQVTAALRTLTSSGEATFSLTATDTGAFSPAEWELDPVTLRPVTLELTFGVQEIEIAGERLPVSEIETATEDFTPRVVLSLLPGTYEITVPALPPWVSAVPLSLEVPPAFGEGVPTTGPLGVRLDEAGREEVQQQVEEILEACAEHLTSAPDDCPFAVADPARAQTGQDTGAPTEREGSWRITEMPEVETAPVSLFLWVVVGSGTAEFMPAGGEADGADAIVVPFALENALAAIDPGGGLTVQLTDRSAAWTSYCVDAETGVLTGVLVAETSDEEWADECR